MADSDNRIVDSVEGPHGELVYVTRNGEVWVNNGFDRFAIPSWAKGFIARRIAESEHNAAGDDGIWQDGSVCGCARCDEDHPMRWQKLRASIAGWTHVGECPETGEPVFMRIVEADDG